LTLSLVFTTDIEIQTKTRHSIEVVFLLAYSQPHTHPFHTTP